MSHHVTNQTNIRDLLFLLPRVRARVRLFWAQRDSSTAKHLGFGWDWQVGNTLIRAASW
jgi:hypothetical protein